MKIKRLDDMQYNRPQFIRTASICLISLWTIVISACLSGQDSAFKQHKGLEPTTIIKLAVPQAKPTGLVCTTLTESIQTTTATYRQTFFDDFNTLNLDWTRWRPHYDGGYDAVKQRWLGYEWFVKRTLQGNKEQQIYVDPGYKGTGSQALGLNPFVLSDGELHIIANKIPEHLRSVLHGYQFTSGLLTSRASFTQKYGFFEIRAKIPAGQALWPAFWLLPEDKSWPPEIDIFEVVGQTPEKIVQTTHWVDPDTGKRKASGCRTKLPSSTTSFHQFGVMWNPERITYYIDRTPVAEMPTPPGLEKRMYILINMAVGGIMVGQVDERTPFPAKFMIDWVAAYEYEADQHSNQ